TTCDYPGSTKPKFRADYQRDGLMRITRLTHTHQTLNQADSGYDDLGSWDYTYDTASNLLTANQTGNMGYLDADRTYAYDTLDRLLTARLTDTQNWTAAAVQHSARIKHRVETDS
ncbi:MAG: hypothetical protein L6R00_21560, partial [Phycisphaerae bacterium]|nr:hypothetical protein [Phycisphaerae bacterium]